MAVNLLFLVADIAVAHSVNRFHHPAEWIPLIFSAVAGSVMLALVAAGPSPHRGRGRWVGEVVAWAAVVVGVAGLIWHLSGEFFQVVALSSLVYSAPFVAPLAYTGLGLLLLMNRRVDARDDPEWGWWALVLAFAGIVGNFGLSLADHARNGFFDWREWGAVVGAAIGVGCVLVAILWPRSREARRVAWVGLGLQVVLGIIGLVLHLMPLVTEASGAPLWDRIVYGPPVFAPLLFANLALPAALGLWASSRHPADPPPPAHT